MLGFMDAHGRIRKEMYLKALSIKQPWVYTILYEGKNIENRTWQRQYRGWVAIHASKSPRTGARFPRGSGKVPNLKTLDYSAICGVAPVVDIVTKTPSKWFQRPNDDSVNFGWVMANINRLKRPIPCSGALGLWPVPPGVLRAIKRQPPRLNLGS